MGPPSTKSHIRELQQMLRLTGTKQSNDELYFICVDLEAFEHNQDIVTEIGVSVLTSSSIKDVDPGDNGSIWFDKMQHLHLRPQETSHLMNKRFIKGCPENFNFGTSVFPKLAECGQILQRIFNDPSKLLEAVDLTVPIADTRPKIALVGHDLSNDTKYMRKLSFTPTNISMRLDTQSLSRPNKKSSPGLLRLLRALEIDATNLHNAGNDAAYTLQALVSIAVKEHHEPGSVGTAVETAFRNARMEKDLRKGKPKTFKAARERAAQDAATASELQTSTAMEGNVRTELAEPVETSSSSSNQHVDVSAPSENAELENQTIAIRRVRTSPIWRRVDTNGHRSASSQSEPYQADL